MVAVSRVARGPARALIGRAREIDRGVDLVGGLIRETPRDGRLATAGSIRMTLSLAFLAPDIVKAAVEGRLRRGYGLNRLVDRPMAGQSERSQQTSSDQHLCHCLPGCRCVYNTPTNSPRTDQLLGRQWGWKWSKTYSEISLKSETSPVTALKP
jgi:hypothetical protein